MPFGAYGQFNQPLLPYAHLGAGFRTPFGTLIPPGGNIIYLRSTGPQSFDPPEIALRLTQTLSAALGQCRAGRADRIVALKGHSESVTDNTMLTNLVAGTMLIGDGDPEDSDAPVFRWTNTAGSWVVDDANFACIGVKLRLEGANGVTKAINTTAAGAKFMGCDIEIASGAALKAAIAFEVGTGADNFSFCGNNVRGTTDIVTSFLKVVAAVDRLRVNDNEMTAAVTAASGFVEVGAVAATNIKVLRNVMANTAASSTACISFGAAASTGIVADNYMSTLNNGVATAQGVTFGAGSLVRAFQNFSSDEPQKSGVLTPGPVAT